MCLFCERCVRLEVFRELIPFLYFTLSLLFLSSSPLLKEKDNKLLSSVSLYSHKKEAEWKRRKKKRERETLTQRERASDTSTQSHTHTHTHTHRYSVTFFLARYTGHTQRYWRRERETERGKKREKKKQAVSPLLCRVETKKEKIEDGTHTEAHEKWSARFRQVKRSSDWTRREKSKIKSLSFSLVSFPLLYELVSLVAAQCSCSVTVSLVCVCREREREKQCTSALNMSTHIHRPVDLGVRYSRRPIITLYTNLLE